MEDPDKYFPRVAIMAKIKAFDNSIYRLVIRNIQGYGEFQILPKGTRRAVGVCPALDQLKRQVLDYLLRQESKRTAKPIHWSIAWQTHAASGLPHLDILVVFQKNIKPYLSSFDYLIKKLNIRQRDVGDDVGVGHVWVTPYSPKKINKAVLQYGQKQDPAIISNMTSQTKEDLVRVHKLKADPYRYLQLQMLKDPLHFKLHQYCRKHDLFKDLVGWSSIVTKLKASQLAAANLKLKQKPGFKYIDRALIEQRLTNDELRLYDSWEGYQVIVDKLNQIVLHGCERPFKSKQLLLVGKPNTGKTSLVRQLQQHCAVYHLDVSNWFPNYRDKVYSLLFWDQFKLKGGMSHTDLLKFLQGSPMDLQYKGGSSLRRDNQLIIMTSNMTLQQHIRLKFKDEQQRQLASKTLSVRIQQVLIPAGLELFVLLKLVCDW